MKGRFFLDSWRLAGLLLLVCAAVSAHAAYRAMEDQAAKTAQVAAVPTGYEAQDHFPGAAALYAADEPEVAPVAIKGATGTTDLPDLPLPQGVAKAVFDQASLDATIRPAAPFSMASASTTDRARALECLTTAIYYEAATEPDKGQQAVAQVILNRVRHPAFPATVCGVVYQGSEKSGCQFSFACDGSMLRGRPSQAYWLRAARVAAAALGGYVCAEVGLATHYHTYAVTPAWNRKLVMTAAIGAHFFHRWQGWWGTPTAFRQGYAGGEPFPGPHPRAVPEPVMPLTLTAATVPPTPQAAIQPAYAQSGAPVAAARPARAEPQSGDVLDRWKDAGKPLR